VRVEGEREERVGVVGVRAVGVGLVEKEIYGMLLMKWVSEGVVVRVGVTVIDTEL
jgi:hypothetical protein